MQAQHAACSTRMMQGAASSTDVRFMVLRVLAWLGADASAAREAKRITNFATAAAKVAAEQIVVDIFVCMKVWAGPDQSWQAACLGNCLRNSIRTEAKPSYPLLSGTLVLWSAGCAVQQASS